MAHSLGPAVTLTAPSSTSVNEDVQRPTLPQLTITESNNAEEVSSSIANSSSPPSPAPTYTSALPLTSTALRDNDPNKLSSSGRSFQSTSTIPDEATTLAGSDSPVKDNEKAREKHEQDMQGTTRVALDPPKSNWKTKLFFWRRHKGDGEAEDALAVVTIPDPSDAEMGKFTLKPSQLRALVDPKSVEQLTSLGGLAGLEKALQTSVKDGLSEEGASSGSGIPDRQKVYLPNVLDQRKAKSLLALMWAAFTDKVLILLTVAAVISLALGIYQAVGTDPVIVNGQAEPQVQWVEGLAIIVAIAIVVLVGSLNDYQKELQFKKLSAQKEERFIKVVRNGGREKLINVHDVVVGDVCQIEPGEIIPVDGVFISGHNVRADESSTTGESDAIRKAPYEEVLASTKGGTQKAKADCFILSGSKILEGNGTYLATCVGKHSIFGGIMTSLTRKSHSSDTTPLQIKLNHLAEVIAKLGLTSGLLLFFALMIRFFVELARHPERTPDEKAQNFINVLIIAVTIIVVAVPEGLPLAVTLALAFATKRMTKENLLVRVLASCETMANTTVVCTDKTGTLTQNVMSVVAGSVGVHLKFADRLTENKSRANANDDMDPSAEREPESPVVTRRKGRLDFSMDMADISKVVVGPLRKLFNEAITINSTAFEGEDEKGRTTFIGSKTETALLAFAKNQQWKEYSQVRKEADIAQVFPFSSERKCSGVVLRLPGTKGARLHVKGASEILERKSTKHVHVVNPNSKSFSEADQGTLHNEDGEMKAVDFTPETKSNVERSIIFYANQSLRTIALCYRDFPVWPPPGVNLNEQGEVEDFEEVNRELTLLAITAIEDPLRPGVVQAVAECQAAGVQVKMCTGDNVLTARSIGTQCGIFTPGGLIMEGPHFRTLSDDELQSVLPRLQILARSSPQDKERLVAHLRSEPLREVVGVTGDGMNDAPALKKANVGFSMGIAGTEVAKEASDIVLMDDNFASIVTAIVWGRCVNDSVRKFLQFQLSVNIVAVLSTFITAVSNAEEESVLTAVQLLWVNLIMDTFAALALATDPATRESLKRKPDRLSAPLISVNMWKLITGQSIYQLTVALVLHFAGPAIFGTHDADPNVQLRQERELATLTFNQFVFCQIFNLFNARILDRSHNIFAGFYKNFYFLAIWFIMIGGQVLIVFVGGAAFSVVRISGTYWAISIIIGLVSLPLGVLIRLLPNGPCAKVFDAVEAGFDAIGHAFMSIFVALRLKKKKDKSLLPVTQQEADQKFGVPLVLDNLRVLSTVRGGRTRSSSIVRRSRAKELEKHDIHPISLMSVIPSLVMSSIGTAWRPDGNSVGSLSDPAADDPSASSAALWTGLAQAHPDTPRDDPLLAKYGVQKFTEAHAAQTQQAGNATNTSAPGSPASLSRHRRTPSASSHMSSVGTIPEDIAAESNSGFGDSLKPPS